MDIHSDANRTLLGPDEDVTVFVYNIFVDLSQPTKIFEKSTDRLWWLAIYDSDASRMVHTITLHDNYGVFQPKLSQSNWKHCSFGMHMPYWRFCVTFRKVNKVCDWGEKKKGWST